MEIVQRWWNGRIRPTRRLANRRTIARVREHQGDAAQSHPRCRVHPCPRSSLRAFYVPSATARHRRDAATVSRHIARSKPQARAPPRATAMSSHARAQPTSRAIGGMLGRSIYPSWDRAGRMRTWRPVTDPILWGMRRWDHGDTWTVCWWNTGSPRGATRQDQSPDPVAGFRAPVPGTRVVAAFSRAVPVCRRHAGAALLPRDRRGDGSPLRHHTPRSGRTHQPTMVRPRRVGPHSPGLDSRLGHRLSRDGPVLGSGHLLRSRLPLVVARHPPEAAATTCAVGCGKMDVELCASVRVSAA
jgi:hypothetical protein